MDYKDIVLRIKQLRDRCHLSARELSLQLGKNSPYITKLEAGEYAVPIQVLLEIIEICGSTPEEFFHRDMLAYKKDKELLDYFSKLDENQKNAILNLYKTK